MNNYILNYHDKSPKIAPDAFIAQGAAIIGDVEIGSLSSVWFNSVIRGDVEKISIGSRSNIQDVTTIHVSRNQGPTIIGSGVTIGHKALLHACTICDNAFIGMGAILLDKVIIEPYAMVAAGSLVTMGKVVRTGEIWAGSPAKFFRKMTDAELRHIDVSAENYVKHAIEYSG